MKKRFFLKNIFVGILIAAVLLVQGPFLYGILGDVSASELEAPSAPSAPRAPSAPDAPDEPKAPSAPEAPDAPEAPEAPEPPSAPSDPTPTPTPEINPDSNGSETGGNTRETSSSPSSNTNDTGGVSKDGQTGDTTIKTGDASNTGIIVTNANNNVLSNNCPSCGSASISAENSENGSNSTNSTSAKVVDNKTTNQTNAAIITNTLNQGTTTGGNSASKNVGNSSITTGDANTSGTVISAVNTNVDGVAVAEFNVVDDHIGDIVIDFAAGCIYGCGSDSVSSINSGNGAGSSNNANSTQTNSEATFQNNDATLLTDMTLTSDSGRNEADKNTAGDSTITTGDANVSANVLNFANNNLSGEVYYATVNIYGNLVGDIILPEEALSGCCGIDSATAANTGNGANSSNNANTSNLISDSTVQANTANIQNNINVEAETGENTTEKNTNGTSSVETGDANVLVQAVNIVNSNIKSSATWWLVIINEGGRWIGRILGAPEGVNYAGSEGTEFIVDENGEVTAVNSGNGADSKNNTSASQSESTTTTQTNSATIVNNINLSANTGGNSASKNTGGDSKIVTGDATIIANIVNFVNNNIVAGGRLFVTVVNVFGSWIGDFVGPGYSKEKTNSESGIGGASGNNLFSTQSNSQNSDSLAQNSQSGQSQVETANLRTNTNQAGRALGIFVKGNSLNNSSSSDPSEDKAALNVSGGSDAITAKRTIKINLAWFILVIPFVFAVKVFRRKFAAHAA